MLAWSNANSMAMSIFILTEKECVFALFWQCLNQDTSLSFNGPPPPPPPPPLYFGQNQCFWACHLSSALVYVVTEAVSFVSSPLFGIVNAEQLQRVESKPAPTSQDKSY